MNEQTKTAAKEEEKQKVFNLLRSNQKESQLLGLQIADILKINNFEVFKAIICSHGWGRSSCNPSEIVKTFIGLKICICLDSVFKKPLGYFFKIDFWAPFYYGESIEEKNFKDRAFYTREGEIETDREAFGELIEQIKKIYLN